jgi:hypothetical protein
MAMARNQRLYDAIRLHGQRPDELAYEVGADPKTVERWIASGRLPRPATRQRIAQVLAVPESVLWPDAPGAAYGASELVAVYTTRRELSPATISSLLDAAQDYVDILAYSGLWLWDSVPNFAERVAQKVASGITVRLCLGDPESDAVALRGQEEGSNEGMAGRCRIAASYAAVIQRVDAGALRQSGATLYNSLLRFDDEVLVNTHFWGNPAADSPVFHLRRHDDQGIAATALRSFERVWEAAQPVPVG